MSDIDLDALRALADNATPGPWEAHGSLEVNALGDLLGMVDAALALHYPEDDYNGRAVCVGCSAPYPCPTVRALGATE